ncbi:MAG: nitroreductase family protein [Bacteroidales bacterium]|nr:nitroreductase family protein [Bacteroidales bacterium]
MRNESLVTCINSRRSIRKYSEKVISGPEINEILKAAMQAPSAVNRQPWHFVVIKNRELLRKIADIHPNASFVVSASHSILVCGDEKLEHDKGYSILDCSAATQNMLLAAHALGIGACWIGIHPREKRKRAFSELFELPDHVKPIALVSLGYPAEEKKPAERFSPNRIHFDTWGNQ